MTQGRRPGTNPELDIPNSLMSVSRQLQWFAISIGGPVQSIRHVLGEVAYLYGSLSLEEGKSR